MTPTGVNKKERVVRATALRAMVETRRVHDAWRLLQQAHQRDVRRFILARAARPDATDLCRDVWGAIYRELPAYQGTIRPRLWVFAIVRARVGDRPRLAETSLDRALVSASAVGRRLRIAETAGLTRSLRALSQIDRDLLELRYVFDFATADVARLLGRPVDVIEARLAEMKNEVRRAIRASR